MNRMHIHIYIIVYDKRTLNVFEVVELKDNATEVTKKIRALRKKFPPNMIQFMRIF